MTILRSVELRWFCAMPLPRSEDRFDYESWSDPEDRVDDYLLMGNDATGIKLRQSTTENKFEIKTRQRVLGNRTLLRRTTGIAEEWLKWSVDGKVVKALAGQMKRSARLVSVRKRRWLQKISLDGARPAVVEAKARPTNGCGVELTRLTCKGKNAWSFGFEAFGDAGNEVRNLRVATNYFAAKATLPARLHLRASYSYPAWLKQFE